MACFIVPTVEAIAVTVADKVANGKEQEKATVEVEKESAVIPFKRKLKWLTSLLWGGSALLAFEHVWHGEVVPWFPFLTAMDNAKDAAEMFHEMGTVGVSMAALITAIWAVMCVVSDHIVKRPAKEAEATVKK